MVAEVFHRFAQDTGDARLAPIVAALSAPVRVTVCGRRGVGRATLARALAGRWRIVDADSATGAELAVVAFAEVVKPEDTAELARWRARQVPTLLVRTKADLGDDPNGVPCAALLAHADLDAESIAALQLLADAPADLRSVPAFLDAEHPVEPDVRRRLLRTLDRFGIGVCVAALQRGVEPDRLGTVLRDAGGIDTVHRELDRVAVSVRYRRAQAAVAALRVIAVRGDPGEVIAGFLAGDDLVLAMMAAAVDVLQAAGLTVDPGDSGAAHLRRAVRWRAYSRGPVGALHRACGADVYRGSLRLLARPDVAGR
ncbi:hypothetical protein JRC04_13640 [Mycolicibacterium sp. S2-37]|nr:hypothetical protein [Mycolicibacterium sp. S2-37]